MKLPAFQFYPGDWRKDPAVQSLSFHDRGVWFEILCLMHESDRRGILLLNGKPIPNDALARLLGLDRQTLDRTLTRLLEMGVASRCLETGGLLNRRMVRDEGIRKKRQEAGKLGGNPRLLNQTSNQTSSKALANCLAKPKQIPEDEVEDEDVAFLGRGGVGGKPSHSQPIHAHARVALHYLNERVGAHFREVDHHLGPISDALRSDGVDIDGVKIMIDRQVRSWAGTRLAEHLTPHTLFDPQKFATYYDRRSTPINKADTPIPGSGADRNRYIAGAQKGPIAGEIVRLRAEAAAKAKNGASTNDARTTP